MIKQGHTQFVMGDRLNSIRFNLLRGAGHLPRFLYNRLVWNVFPKWHIVTRFPQHVDIEITNVCNMNCPMCYTVLPAFVRLKHGFMEFDLYKKIVNECAEHGAYSIRLSIRGETLLHPDLIQMIRYAKKKRIPEVAFLTNGLLLTEELSEDIIDAELDWMTVSWDGLGKVYERYRAPAKFDEAVERLKTFQDIKRRKRKAKPVVNVSTVWSAIKDDPKAFYRTFKPIVERVTCNPTLDFDSRLEQDPHYACPFPWQRFVIYWSGQVMQCINDPFEKSPVGNVRDRSIREIWRSARMEEVRRAMIAGNGERLKKWEACRSCSYGALRVPTTVDVDSRKIRIELEPNKYNFRASEREQLIAEMGKRLQGAHARTVDE